MKGMKKFLLASALGLAALCIACFAWLGMFIGAKSKEAIDQIGIIYMSEVSRQLQEKFDAVIRLRLSQIEGIIKRTPWESAVYGEEMKNDLARSGSIREFDYLGLYTEDGRCEVIYGDPVVISDQGQSQLGKERAVISGTNEAGERFLLPGFDAGRVCDYHGRTDHIVDRTGDPAGIYHDALTEGAGRGDHLYLPQTG